MHLCDDDKCIMFTGSDDGVSHYIPCLSEHHSLTLFLFLLLSALSILSFFLSFFF